RERREREGDRPSAQVQPEDVLRGWETRIGLAQQQERPEPGVVVSGVRVLAVVPRGSRITGQDETVRVRLSPIAPRKDLRGHELKLHPGEGPRNRLTDGLG